MARASVLDTLRVATTALMPIVARGALLRRPSMVRAQEKADADRRLVRLLQRLRDTYGEDRLRLRVPGRSISLVLSREDVQHVLSDVVTYTPANVEKRHALAHFQPDGLLISDAADRPHRRTFTEAVLDTHSSVHALGDVFASKVDEEVTPTAGRLDWDDFAASWWRLVRRIVLGDSAADDSLLIERLKSLRANANWSYFHREEVEHREIFLRHVRSYVDRAEPGSLAARIAAQPAAADVHPESQVAHWLFAFDAAGMATFQALALLASHPSVPRDQDHLRASVLESVRLWPTTPLVLRDSAADGSTLLILAPFFHRDDQRLSYANAFEPEVWLDGRADHALIPFSDGPAVCPGRNLVLFIAAKTLSAMFLEHDFMLTSHPQLAADEPLPGTLNPLGLRFAVTARTVDEVPVG
ncbi:cytochrome P450 [Allokutzneria albata]|uniref:Cytochrome P450 n=1 Tax=Allokutzneria albata TaxID=211114 RepID=A0A1G9TRA6_ALLAB|nr:cytochrome P450 [Allokutzneria albata]SDM50192.1 Cytochrome P450 [Allokutzneria albata]